MAQGDITIRIKKGSVGDNKTTIDSETGTNDTLMAQTKETQNKNALFAVFAMQAFNYAKEMTINSAEYFIERSFQLTDDYEGQRDFNIAKGFLKRGIAIGGAIVSGAVTGFKAGGPIGAVIGASVSGVGSIGMDVINTAQGIDKQNIAIAQLNEQLSYTRQRAGYSLTSGSIGDNK